MVRTVAKHIPRNQKKYWRKISTTELEDQLEDVRVQEMTGGRRSDQPDHVLYQIDNEHPLGAKSPPVEAKQYSAPVLRSIPKQRQPLDLNNLNTYKNLQPHSSVLPPGTDSRRKKDSSSKAAKRLIESQQEVETRKAATKKYQHATRQRSKALEKNALDKANQLEFDDPNVSKGYDLWNMHDEKKEKVRSVVGPNMASFMEQVYQTYDWKVPKHITKKPTKLPAVERPLAGTSYNPTFDDHQDLLQKAVDVELEKE
jgi:hypothetical protein